MKVKGPRTSHTFLEKRGETLFRASRANCRATAIRLRGKDAGQTNRHGEAIKANRDQHTGGGGGGGALLGNSNSRAQHHDGNVVLSGVGAGQVDIHIENTSPLAPLAPPPPRHGLDAQV